MGRSVPWLRLAAALAVLILSAPHPMHGQQPATADRAIQIVDLLVREQFDEVAGQFNAQMSAALPPAQLKTVWAGLVQQIGAFRARLDQRVQPAANGNTAVALGCQFERAALNVIVTFDAEGKISGLRMVPRPVPSADAVAPPQGSRFTEEPLTVGSGEWALPGTLSLPANPIAAAILVHGSGPQDRDETIGANKPFRDLAWGLADRGVAVLRYEKRSHQYAGKLASISGMTVQHEVIDDAVAAVARLRQHPPTARLPVIVIGHSLGATLAPRIAQGDPDVAGLVIMAGAVRPLMEVAREQLAYLASIAPPGSSVDQQQALDTLRRAAPESYWKDLDAYHPAQVAATVKRPMLILQGERDYQVSMTDFELWRRALRGRSDVTFKSYPALNHLFMAGVGKSTPSEYLTAGHVADEVIEDIAAWIKQAAATR